MSKRTSKGLLDVKEGQTVEVNGASTETKRAEWLAQNREALEAYNKRVKERGVFSDGLRRK